jgi:hypothetical protein
MKEKLKLILDYKNTVRQLKEIVVSTSDEELDYRPKNDYWTIREHIAHVPIPLIPATCSEGKRPPVPRIPARGSERSDAG